MVRRCKRLQTRRTYIDDAIAAEDKRKQQRKAQKVREAEQLKQQKENEIRDIQHLVKQKKQLEHKIQPQEASSEKSRSAKKEPQVVLSE